MLRAAAQEQARDVGLFFVILPVFLGIFGPFIAPYPYTQQDLKAVVANGNKARCRRGRPATSSGRTSSAGTC